ncbi:MAG: TolC family protein [candidate division KSB1 bacterium]|nr:TolC family protein [candidate division KSB1 bacterium]
MKLNMTKWASAFSLAAILSGPPVFAQRRVDGLNGLIQLLVERNPQLRAYQRISEAESRAARAEGTLPNPTIGFGLRNVGWNRLSVGEEMMSGVVAEVSQSVPFPGKLALRRSSAMVRASRSREAVRESRLRLIREAKELYAEIFYYQRIRDLLQEKRSVLQEALGFAQARFAVGQVPQADLFKAQLEISETDVMVLDAEQMLGSLQARLSALVALPAESVVVVARELPLGSLPYSFPELEERARSANPLLTQARLQVAEESLAVRLARKDFLPDFMLRAGLMYRGPFRDMYEGMVGVEAPLYFWKKERDRLAAETLRLEGTRLGAQDLENRIRAELKQYFVVAKSAETKNLLYRDQLIPQAERSLQAALSRYQVGQIDLLPVLSAVDTLITYRTESARILTDLWTAIARLEELTGLEILVGR